MVAIAGAHQTGITVLAAFIKAPLLEGFHHLAYTDIGIQSPGTLRAGILRMLHRKLGKALLGAAFRYPLVQQCLRLHTALFPFLIGIDNAVFRILRATLGADQNMPYIRGDAAIIDNPLLIQGRLVLQIIRLDFLRCGGQLLIEGVQILSCVEMGIQISQITVYITRRAHIHIEHGLGGFKAVCGGHFFQLFGEAFQISL